MNWDWREYGWRLWPGGLAALVITALWQLNVLTPFEQIAYRTLFRLRGQGTASPEVVIVAIDEKSIGQLGRFPWPRQHYTRLLERLTAANASVVTFNLLWSEPTASDAALATTMTRQGRVVLAQGWDGQGLPLLPVAPLRETAIATGHILKKEDTDGITRQIDLYLQGQPALAVAAVKTHSLVHTVVPLPPLGQPLWINWAETTVPQYSFIDVLTHQVPASTFQNKIVVVGVTAAGIDALVTPFERNPPATGVHLHATVISNLLQQTWLRPIAVRWGPLLMLGAGAGLSLLLSLWRTRIQILVWLALFLGWGGLGFVLLRANYLLPIAPPLVLITSVVVAVAIGERLRMNALLQRQIQHLWQTYYPDLVQRSQEQAPTGDQDLELGPGRKLPPSMQEVSQLSLLAEQFGRSQSTQAAIARSLSIGLLAADLDGYIWFCNPVAAAWLQVQVGESLPSRLVPTWLTPHQWRTYLNHLNTRHPPDVLEVQQYGHWFELKFERLIYGLAASAALPPAQAASPQTPVAAAPTGLLLVIENITDRKQAAIAQAQLNQQLTERTNQLEAVNQELETFNYAVSHDLRGPLWRINGFSEALLEDNIEQLDPTGIDYLHRIRASAQRMEEIVEDLLKLSRLTTVEMHPQPFNCSELVAEIAQELQQTEPQRPTKWIIAPDVILTGDRRLLKIALENLLGNAWKFTSQQPQPQIEFGTITTSDQWVRGFIRDNGIGFDMTYQERLFVPFRRLPNAQTFPGTGIGLMTSQRIIHRHGGRIWAESQLNQGATFYLELPRSQPLPQSLARS